MILFSPTRPLPHHLSRAHLFGIFALLASLLVGLITPALALPKIETSNGMLNIVLPTNALASLVFEDEDGVRTSPVSLASLQDLSDLQTLLMDKIDALEAKLATKVDVQNLTVIDAHVRGTVNAMVAGVPAASNNLAEALGSKLTLNATCQCYDPRTTQMLQSDLSSATSIVGSQAVASAVAMSTLNSSLITSASSSLNSAITPLASSLTSLSSTASSQSSAVVSVTASLATSLNTAANTWSSALSAVSSTSTSNTAQLSTSITALSSSLSSSLVASTAQLSTAIFATASNATATSSQLSTAIFATASNATATSSQLSSALSSLSTNMSTTTSQLSAAVSGVGAAAGSGLAFNALNASLALLSSQTQANIRALNLSLVSYYVDVRNLSTIDGEIVSVVTGMVGGIAPYSNNALATTLTSKVNSSQVTALISSSIRCQTAPTSILYGDVSACAGTVSAGSCTPTCIQGYSPAGVYSCAAGTWIGSPRCAPNPCFPLLVAPSNGAASILNGTTGMNSTFSCTGGFSLVGASLTTCLPTGSWSVATPTCQANGLTPQAPVASCTVITITTTGVYYMAIPGYLGDVFLAFCRVDPDGTKWLIFQRRTDTASFEQNWATYAAGFGTPTTNNFTGPSFWLGLERLNRITSTGSWKLRVDLQEIYSGTFQSYFQQYSQFSIGSAASRYVLACGGTITGTAGDSLSARHSGFGFNTYDNDISGGCVAAYKGGWWYNGCHASNLNGIFYAPGCHTTYADGVNWQTCPTSCSGGGYFNSMRSWMAIAPGP